METELSSLGRALGSVLILFAALAPNQAQAACGASEEVNQRGYDPMEMASNSFFTNRELTKFARNRNHFPIADGARATYCFSRGCTGQVYLEWSANHVQQLQALRDRVVREENAASELLYLRLAVVQMEEWLTRRLKTVDTKALKDAVRRKGGFGKTGGGDGDWVAQALASHGDDNKECVTYAMEATQHLMVLANLGLVKHHFVRKPYYVYGIPGHWTAALQSRETCQALRFDLNTSAGRRASLIASGRSPLAEIIDHRTHGREILPGYDSPSGMTASYQFSRSGSGVASTRMQGRN